MKLLLFSATNYKSKRLKKFLLNEGFYIDTFDSPDKGLCVFESREYDAVMIHHDSQMDAFKIIDDISKLSSDIPVVLLLDENDNSLRVDALMSGFDDVFAQLTPFIEISIRLKTLIRKSSLSNSRNIISYGDIEMDVNYRTVTRDGRIIFLRRKEFEILEYMLLHPGQVLSRQRLLNHVWPEEMYHFTNTVDVHISSIRKKIDKRMNRKMIYTVHGVGYKIFVDK